MKPFGIHIRLLISAILLIVATTLTLGTIGVKTVHQFVRSRFEERVQFLAKYLALNAELGILIGERTTLRRLSENLLTEKDVVRVMIFDDAGETLANVSKPPHNKGYASVTVPVELQSTNYDTLAFPGDGPAEPRTRTIGSVRILYTTEGIDHLLTVMKKRLLWLAVGLSFMAVVVFYFISRSLVSPVTKIAAAARKYAQGDLEARPVPGSLPETRELTLAFNSMLDSIEWSTKALEDAYQEMIQQNTLAELGKFSMMIAHEFKNPLSIIKGSLNNFKKRLPAELEKDLMVQYMDEEMTRLNRMIEDFLAFSKPLTPVFRSIDLNETLASCVEKFSFTAEAAQVDIRARVGGKVCTANADRDILGRVFGNLLKNAVESSGKQSRVLVSAEVVAGMWEMRVCDEGSGIPGEYMEKIFEPFFTTRAKGSGLGLAFARQVVKAHNGEIYAQNNENGGACFTVRLPLSAEAAAGIGGATTG